MPLADKLDTPKPTEREWQVGDVVQLMLESVCDGRIVQWNVAKITKMSRTFYETNLRPYHNMGCYTITQDKEDWANLSIKAEQAGEKE